MTIEEKVRRILTNVRVRLYDTEDSSEKILSEAAQAILALMKPMSREKLIEVIKLKIKNLPIAGDFDATSAMYLNDKAIEGVADTILAEWRKE